MIVGIPIRTLSTVPGAIAAGAGLPAIPITAPAAAAPSASVIYNFFLLPPTFAGAASTAFSASDKYNPLTTPP